MYKRLQVTASLTTGQYILKWPTKANFPTGGTRWSTVWSAGLPHRGGVEQLADDPSSAPSPAQALLHCALPVRLRSTAMGRQLCSPLWLRLWLPFVFCVAPFCLFWRV